MPPAQAQDLPPPVLMGLMLALGSLKICTLYWV